MAHEIQERMTERMRRRMRGPQETSARERAVQRLRGVGLGYIAFAVDEPGWFATAFFGSADERAVADADADADDDAEVEVVPPPFALLSAALEECVTAGVLAPARRPGAEFVCWSAVHGFAELALHGPLRGAEPALVRELSERVVEDIITGIR